MAHARRLDWTVAPSLGWFALAFAAALLLLDGHLESITRLLTHTPETPTVAGPAFVATAATAAAEHAADVDPPLPPPPDLTPLPAAGGIPTSIPGKTLEEVCVEPAGDPDHCRHWTMDGFYAALAATEDGTATAPVRVSFYGDSVSATDALPGRLRARLQDTFGDGGPGFIHAIQPHRFNHSESAVRRSTGTWRTWAVSMVHVGDALYGVGNSTAEGYGTIRLLPKNPTGNLSRVEVYYLAQPHGGTAELKVDGQVAATVDTAAETKKARFEALTVTDATHKVELTTTRGRVRLFGFTLERDKGVVVDNMALVSATAKNLLNNGAEHWRSQLAHRGADLIVIMLGTNEAQWVVGGRAMAEYEEVWTRLLQPVRAARPKAACLVVAPLDQAEVRDGQVVARRGLPDMVDTQRRAAHAAGCAFWDTFTWMGGSGSAIKWRRKGFLGGDFAHMSRRGTATVADGLADALLSGYKAYKAR